MEKLPADLLPYILDHVVFHHLEDPHSRCRELHELLSLRLVCHDFDAQVSQALARHITFPNVWARVHPVNAKRLTVFVHNLSTNPETRTRDAILASALWNSIRGPQLQWPYGDIIIQLKNCISIAASTHAQSPYPGTCDADQTFKDPEVAKFICRAAPKSPFFNRPAFNCGTRLMRPTINDTLCIYALFGRTEELLALVASDAPPAASSGESSTKVVDVHQNGILGSPLDCAIVGGRLETVTALLSFLKPSYYSIWLAVDMGHVEILKVLTEHTLTRSAHPGVDDLQSYHLDRYKGYVVRAVKSGNVEALGALLKGLKKEHFLSAESYEEEVLKLRDMAFVHSVRFGKVEVLKMMLKSGIDINRRDAIGDSALEIARSKGFSTIEGILRGAGAEESAMVKQQEDSDSRNWEDAGTYHELKNIAVGLKDVIASLPKWWTGKRTPATADKKSDHNSRTLSKPPQGPAR